MELSTRMCCSFRIFEIISCNTRLEEGMTETQCHGGSLVWQRLVVLSLQWRLEWWRDLFITASLWMLVPPEGKAVKVVKLDLQSLYSQGCKGGRCFVWTNELWQVISRSFCYTLSPYGKQVISGKTGGDGFTGPRLIWGYMAPGEQ